MQAPRSRRTHRCVSLLVLLGLLLSLSPVTPAMRAQTDCRAEVEPNNVEAEVEPVESEFCIAGDLPAVEDQDLFLWTVTETDAKFLWSMSATGPIGVVTSAKLLAITSEPGVYPVVAGTQLVDATTTPETTGPVSVSFLVAPGQYLVGISRTDSAAGGPPLTTGYELELRRAERLAKRLDKEPNEDNETASAVAGSFETAGDLMGSVDIYAWTLTEADAVLGWELHLQVALGQTAGLLITADQPGSNLVNVLADSQGRLDLFDLALEPGTYYLQIGPAASTPAPYILRSRSGERPAQDLEPNDLPASAVEFDLTNPVVKGRLAARNDVDTYRLAIDDQLAGSLFDLRLLARTDQNRRLCIASIETGLELQCKEAVGGAALTNVLLPRGHYLIRITGPADPDDYYILRLDTTSAPAPDFETEPNDTEAMAAVLDPTVPMRGRFDGSETDVYRFTVEGEPQLWEITVSGTNINQLDYSRRDGTELATGSVSADRATARMSDLYLTPGEHWIRVGGEDGEYSVALTPLGPPPPDGERETNNLAATAEPMLIGERKTGRLVEATDVDYFRFSLAAEEHILIELTGPDDGTLELSLDWATHRIGYLQTTAPGEAVALDLMLLPGEYVIALYTRTPSTGRYALQLVRDDPFTVTDDQEPNDTFWSAQRLPAGYEMSGSVSIADPYDYYLIEAGADRDLTFTLDSTAVYLSLTDEAQTPYPLLPSADGLTYTIDTRVSDDLPLYLQVSGDGPYTVQFGETPGSSGLELPGFLRDEPAAPLQAALTVEEAEVAAYWHEGQVVDGLLTITNTTDEQVDFVLSSATSHYHFTVAIDDAPSFIDAGATLDVPVSIQIEPDAWANIPVRITIAALLEPGHVSAYAEITPTAAAPPINSSQWWPVPFDLLGGFDLASPALGAVVAGTFDPVQEAYLHDGVAPLGVAFFASAPVLPLALTVDLAGDGPAPVSGIILNPQPFSGDPREQVREFELLLSTDGANFVSVLRDELSLIVREQSFVLAFPTEATHAQLVIHSTYAPNPTQPLGLSLNEWSVIATPGFVPATVDRLNIADLALGGHVVRTDPQFYGPELAESMLTPDLTSSWLQLLDATSVEWVLGFADNRAAQITEIAMIPAEPFDPARLVTTFDVAISMGTSGGQWESVGAWDATPGADGQVSPFVFDEPVWARYVRLSGPTPAGVLDIELPGQILVYEAPTGDDYRSVIATWGATSSAGYFEQLNPPGVHVFADEADAPDEMSLAAPLELGAEITGFAHAGNDVDWYRVTAPEDDNTLTLTFRGAPNVDVVARIYDDSGEEVSASREIVGDTSTVAYIATVDPGADYFVQVEQPPHSIVFAFDTSGSMSGALPMIYGSLRSFADGITEGYEFVQVMPFETDPLLETWSDDPYAVYAAINAFTDTSGSSSTEATIIEASELLSDQEGTTAILIITDAETTSYDRSAEMWELLDVTRPRIFAVHVAGNLYPARDLYLMQDWSDAGGYYQYAVSQGEMDRAFDRAATWLRRPAGYSLVATSSFEEPATPTPEPTAEPSQPGTLSVTTPEGSDGGDGSAAQISQAVTIEIILDTSGSMLAGLPDGQRRIDVARAVLTDLVVDELPPGVPVALRVFGSTPDSCETTLLVPPGPLDAEAMAATIGTIEPVNLVRTPLGASLEQVANDLAGVSGPKIVVLVTDGEETCDGNPARAIQNLRAQGVDATVNIVGFALDDDGLRAQFSEWAELGGGTYFDATSAEELDEALAKAVQAPFQVLDESGAVIATGAVGGGPISLPAGTYTVVVLTDPEQRYEEVVIDVGERIELEMEQ